VSARLLLKIELHEIANGVLLEITNEARPSPRDPLGQRHLHVGPLFFTGREEALDSVPLIAREALNSEKEREAAELARWQRASTGG
jgi:hypothetical protein